MSSTRNAALALAVLSLTTSLNAGVISTAGQISGTQVNIIGITGFTTLGNEMAGLTVGAAFVGGVFDSCVWAATGADSGGCSTARFSLQQAGDTFSSPWTLSVFGIGTAPSSLVALTLNGITGNTVFDRTFGGLEGTPGSSTGRDANGSTSGSVDGLATYVNSVAILPGSPVGDEFGNLNFTFDNGLAAGQTATFIADTDSIGLPGTRTPEPGTLVLLGVGIAGIATARLRRRPTNKS